MAQYVERPGQGTLAEDAAAAAVAWPNGTEPGALWCGRVPLGRRLPGRGARTLIDRIAAPGDCGWARCGPFSLPASGTREPSAVRIHGRVCAGRGGSWSPLNMGLASGDAKLAVISSPEFRRAATQASRFQVLRVCRTGVSRGASNQIRASLAQLVNGPDVSSRCRAFEFSAGVSLSCMTSWMRESVSRASL